MNEPISARRFVHVLVKLGKITKSTQQVPRPPASPTMLPEDREVTDIMTQRKVSFPSRFPQVNIYCLAGHQSSSNFFIESTSTMALNISDTRTINLEYSHLHFDLFSPLFVTVIYLINTLN